MKFNHAIFLLYLLFFINASAMEEDTKTQGRLMDYQSEKNEKFKEAKKYLCNNLDKGDRETIDVCKRCTTKEKNGYKLSTKENPENFIKLCCSCWDKDQILSVNDRVAVLSENDKEIENIGIIGLRVDEDILLVNCKSNNKDEFKFLHESRLKKFVPELIPDDSDLLCKICRNIKVLESKCPRKGCTESICGICAEGHAHECVFCRLFRKGAQVKINLIELRKTSPETVEKLGSKYKIIYGIIESNTCEINDNPNPDSKVKYEIRVSEDYEWAKGKLILRDGGNVPIWLEESEAITEFKPRNPDHTTMFQGLNFEQIEELLKNNGLREDVAQILAAKIVGRDLSVRCQNVYDG